jgi:hypothetical protein
LYGAHSIETKVPGNSDSRKKAAMKKVVSGEMELWCCDIGVLAALHTMWLMSWRGLVGQAQVGRWRRALEVVGKSITALHYVVQIQQFVRHLAIAYVPRLRQIMQLI